MKPDAPKPVDDRAGAHACIREQLPWYVNGTLEEPARTQVAQHLAVCARCRAEAGREAMIADTLVAAGTLDLAPQAGLATVMERIERRERRRRWLAPLRTWAAGTQRPLVFAVAVQSLVVVMLATALVMALRQPPADFRALTTFQSPAGAGSQLRVVLADDMTLGELRALLAERGMELVGGPGERGVYTLAVRSDAAAALAALRAHPQVRFAEPVAEP